MKESESPVDGPIGLPSALFVHRPTRTLVGPTGTRVELPWLTLQLLNALSDHHPAFVDPKRLQSMVWPDTHISPDALKQRVRLARQSLREAGYDPTLLDSVRGEGYALRVPLADESSDTAPPPARPSPAVSSRYRVTWWQRWRIAVVGALIFTAAVAAEFIGNRRSATSSPPMIGPVPVRVGVTTSTIGDPAADEAAEKLTTSVRSTLAMYGKALAVPMIDRSACDTSSIVHLCAHGTAGATSVRLSVVDRRSGASLIEAEWTNSALTPQTFPESDAHTQLALLLSPGALRWIGGPSPVGDREFAAYLAAVRAFTRCDAAAWRDAIADLESTTLRAPQFRAARALALVMRGVVSSPSDTPINGEADTRALLGSARGLLADDPDLALAHAAVVVAHTRALQSDSGLVAFQRLQRLSPGIASGTERALRCVTTESPSLLRAPSR